MLRTCKAFVLVVIGCMVVLASGCSKTAPNESNFKASVNRMLEVQPMCVGFYDAKSFPVTLLNDKILDLMVGKELLATTPAPNNRVTYNLTDAGRASSMHQAERGFGPLSITDRYFCYGIKKVDKIINYSEPSSVMGQTFVHLSYTWKPAKDLPSWASDPKFGVATGDWQLQSLQTGDMSKTGERKANDTLILTHNGWRHGTDTDF